MSTVITVENLGKKYTLHHQQREQYTALRDVIAESVKGAGRRIASVFNHSPFTIHPSQGSEDFWALKDVSFEVKQGDRIGIIGRNGAGKSTLLKILSRITEPTTGRIKIKGRVASLLEVGTGFHPELTGRENIFLNGAILGMGRVEIRKKFDEIVDFAEIEKFLDMPVKRYSSGMYVRLAFAVAAHLEPEILIVDEVLAVGDFAFQKKCLGKMEDVSIKEGRTVLFVSHNIAAIQKLCKKGMLLHDGSLRAEGGKQTVIDCYLEQEVRCPHTNLSNRKDRRGSGAIRFISIAMQNDHDLDVSIFSSGDVAKFVLLFENIVNRDLRNVVIGIGIDNSMGERIAVASNEINGQVFEYLPKDVNKIELIINRLPLTKDRYCITIFASENGEALDWIQNAGYFEVESADFYGTGKFAISQGNFLLDYNFIIKYNLIA
jgi:lipopolysaccharide transport system ATP-binding protein